MYRSLLSVLLLFYGQLAAQTTVEGSFLHGGITRTYSFYVPASYVPGQAVPLVIGLHGTGSSGDQFAEYRDFRPIADTANFIMVHPDGSTLFGIRFWNYGSVMGSDVDDVGFLEALIDTISADYTINPERVYATGMSNGSFMCYYLACQSDRFAAIGCVTGSMSPDMRDACNPSHPTPALHIHGTEDGTNPYEGTSTMVPIDELNRFWVDQNDCDTTPVMTLVPNTDPGDGATAEHYLFTGGINGNTVELFKIIGGEHSWPGAPMPSSNEVTCMDFEARKEIWRFFSQYTNDAASLTENAAETVHLYPNPAQETVSVESAHAITQVSVYDVQGRIVETITGENLQLIDLGQLKPGNYIVKVSGESFSATKKLIIKL